MADIQLSPPEQGAWVDACLGKPIQWAIMALDSSLVLHSLLLLFSLHARIFIIILFALASEAWILGAAGMLPIAVHPVLRRA